MVVSQDSFSAAMWASTPIPMYNKVYYFNVTNAEDVMAAMASGTDAEALPKPLLKQVGPYTFREEHEKTSINYAKNSTVTFRQKKFWYFEEDLSNGSLDDEIYTINIIAVAAAEGTRWPTAFGADDYPFMRLMMDSTLKLYNQTLFMKARVGNLTFEGIDSELLHMGDDTESEIGDAINANIPFDRFGWFYGRNGSADYDGVFQMTTGEDDIYKVGQISQWNKQDNLERFFPAPCDRLEGSAGEFFPQDQVIRHTY